ncbi:FMRFamide neuropeptide [Lucilia cuprina]|nr:FMRFamide neuropeptide [Lucilia cuprina]
MGPFLVLFLALQLCYTQTLSKVVNDPQYGINSLNDKLNDYTQLLPPTPEYSNENEEFDDDDFSIADINDDDIPSIQTIDDKMELKFRQPIEGVNIDYARNAVVLKFHKNNAKSMMKMNTLESEKKKSVQDNFIRFGKRSYEEFPLVNSLDEGFGLKNAGMRLERSHQTARDARGDNFMRFGRSANTKNDFMRFGRGGNDFMRFGRSPTQDFMRFGRAAASDNFMRFGRQANQDFMRFGRAAGQDFMRFGRSPSQDFMRFGRSPSQDFMRFGRSPNFMRFGRTPSQDFMRFGRAPSQDFMRFGRAGQDNFMRFGRNPQQDFMRFGRTPQQDFMRFGRNTPKIPQNFMRYSRPDNFMRFGRTPPQPSDNFIRFGKSIEKSNDKNSSQPLLGKNELKQAVKLIHEADKNADNENPVDKAIKVLFDKHQQQDQDDKVHSNELNLDSSNQHNDNNDNTELDSDLDYFLKMSK